MDIIVKVKVTKVSLGVEYDTIETLHYNNALGFTFEEIADLNNNMCVVIHLGYESTATFDCKTVISIESN